MIQSINPASQEILAEFEPMSDDQLDTALSRAHDIASDFGAKSNLQARLTGLRSLAARLRQEKTALSVLMTQEMGKPITQSEAEIEKSAAGCEYYAQHAQAFLDDEMIEAGHEKSFIRWLPVGAVLAVMPWNFPLWQVVRFAAPALAAGNVGLLKHASNVPQMALAIETLCLEAGFPKGAFQTLLIGADRVNKVIGDSRVRAVTLTGSEPAGRAVAECAGAHLKKCVLELGGSDPFIVMPSADLERAVETAVKARIQNTGQSCIAAKRFIIHDDIYEPFRDRFVETISRKTLGDPMRRDTDIGPLATPAICKELAGQVEKTVQKGAEIAFQGEIPETRGNYHPVTVLTDIPDSSPAADEELFGPVASLFRVSSAEDAIALANRSRLGLGSAAWTKDAEEQEAFQNRLDAGFTAINGMTSSDPRLPFGGVKDSGFGRELSELGFREFLNAKTVTVDR